MKSISQSSCLFIVAFLSLVAKAAFASSLFRGNAGGGNQDEIGAIDLRAPELVEDLDVDDEENDVKREEEHYRRLAGQHHGGGYGYYPYDSYYYYGYNNNYYGGHSGGSSSSDIPATAIANGMFGTLVAALTAADLVGAISAPNGPFTVFAPTDDAFAALPTGLVDCLLNDIPTLTDILLYHVAEGKVTSSQLRNGMRIPTLQGSRAAVTLTRRGGVFVDESEVILPDVMASNGVIHVIDSVLVPPGVDVAAYLDSCYGYSLGYYRPGNHYGGYHGYQKPYRNNHHAYSF